MRRAQGTLQHLQWLVHGRSSSSSSSGILCEYRRLTPLFCVSFPTLYLSFSLSISLSSLPLAPKSLAFRVLFFHSCTSIVSEIFRLQQHNKANEANVPRRLAVCLYEGHIRILLIASGGSGGNSPFFPLL